MIYSTPSKRPTVNHTPLLECNSLFLWPLISLSPTHTQLSHFNVPTSSPHVSLSKSTDMQWHDIGPIAQMCEQAFDWQLSTPPRTPEHHLTHTHFSPTTGFFHSDCTIFVLAERHLKILSTSSISHTHTLTHEDKLQHPALADISKSLWTTHKYDVGLIKNFFPVVITPKSDYCPTCNQYPLGFWIFTESSCNYLLSRHLFQCTGTPRFTNLVYQGYCKTHTIYNAALCNFLNLTHGNIQYCWFIPLCTYCWTMLWALQLSSTTPCFRRPQTNLYKTFLGPDISTDGKQLASFCMAAIRVLPKPTSKKQLLFSRQVILLPHFHPASHASNDPRLT